MTTPSSSDSPFPVRHNDRTVRTPPVDISRVRRGGERRRRRHRKRRRLRSRGRLWPACWVEAGGGPRPTWVLMNSPVRPYFFLGGVFSLLASVFFLTSYPVFGRSLVCFWSLAIVHSFTLSVIFYLSFRFFGIKTGGVLDLTTFVIICIV